NEVYATINRILTGYAQGWAKMYREACAATSERGEQSAEVLDLRMTCLQERLGGLRALTDLFGDANGEVVENAVSAANNLGPLDRCADVPLLRSVVRPPEDPTTRARVGELRHRLADMKALYDSGRYREGLQVAPRLIEDARAVRYEPLVAETAAAIGKMESKSNDVPAAEKMLVASYLAAEASRDDEVRAEDATNLVWVVGYQQGRHGDGERWAKYADAILQRIGGHELLQAWLLNNLGGIYQREGEREAALRVQQQALARNQEALEHVDRSLAILENGLGASHPELAIQLNNRGEILDALGRAREARSSFEKARIIWERELGLDNPDHAYALTGIGVSYLAEGDAISAITPLERAFKIREAKESDPS